MRIRMPPSAKATSASILLFLCLNTSAQTSSACNPLNAQCPANPALGRTVDIDFRKGPGDSPVVSGTPSYGPDGASFTVRGGGDAPQLTSPFYLLFGRVDVTMRAAPGAGIVSSVVLESDDLDEIDLEWLGARPDELQTNYFGKGRTGAYNRGQFHAVEGTQARLRKYTIDWTSERILWIVDGSLLRTLNRRDALQDQYPQTPMRVKLGAWAGGDPARNAPGTVDWAHGPTNYAAGPFTMLAQSMRIADYSTGREYRYRDQSGTWESIEVVGGAVNGNFKDHNSNDLPASDGMPSLPSSNTGAPSIPVGGMARDGSSAARTQTGWPWVAGASPTAGAIPDGWYLNSEGKIMRSSSAAAVPTTSPVDMQVRFSYMLMTVFVVSILPWLLIHLPLTS